jgi:hypothetical protein
MLNVPYLVANTTSLKGRDEILALSLNRYRLKLRIVESFISALLGIGIAFFGKVTYSFGIGLALISFPAS